MPKLKLLAAFTLVSALSGCEFGCNANIDLDLTRDNDPAEEASEMYQLPEATVKPDTYRPVRTP